MEKFDFHDFYRFCVSLGLALMLFSLLIPWALIRETGWVEATQAAQEVKARAQSERVPVEGIAADLESDKRDAVVQRAHLVSKAYDWVAAVSVAIGVLGFISFVYGFLKWRARQVKRDARENAEIDKILDSAAPKATAEAVSKKVDLDVNAIDDSSFSSDQAQYPASVTGRFQGGKTTAERSQEVERQVLNLIEQDVPEYMVRRERQIGRTVADAILASSSPRTSDIVVEIKLIRRGFKAGWFLEVIQRVSMMVDLYAVRSERPAKGLLIIVIEDQAAKKIDLIGLRSVLTSATLEVYANVSVKIVSAELLANGGLAGGQLVKFDHNVQVHIDA